MYLAEILDESGRLLEGHKGVISSESIRSFVIFIDQNNKKTVSITQRDIREVQLAKSAIRTGIQVLLDSAGRSEEEIEKVIIAGAFGTYIDIESAINIGMLPVLPLDRFVQVGNAAGMGARHALISLEKRLEADRISKNIHYIELASYSGFNKIFVQSQYLGKYRIIDGRREKF
jgi:uncharacterized 2Fe-2S/4Fe-4S cluster protein (DUF4445 family)